MGGSLAATTTATELEFGGAEVILLLVVVAFWLYSGYKCASNGRMVLLVLGLIGGCLFWIIGWAMGPKRPSYRY